MPKKFIDWKNEHRKALKRGYSSARHAGETTLSFVDWAAGFYKIYCEGFYAKDVQAA